MTTTEQHTEPAAWIGCLACYNNGTLRGKWITAQQAADDLTDAIDHDTLPTYCGQAEPKIYELSGNRYAACVHCGGDEFDVFDTQNLPTTSRTLTAFYDDAERLADLDRNNDLERITVLASWLGTESLEQLIDYDAETYCGQWNTFQECADDYIDASGLLVDAPEPLASYFDYEKFARDLAHDYYYDDATGYAWYSA
jgi:antirestriction protein